MEPLLPTEPAPLPPTTFGMGAIVGRTLSIWARSAHQLLALVVAAYAPVAAGWTITIVGTDLVGPAADPIVFFGSSLITVLLVLVQVGAIAHGVLQRLQGEQPTLGAMLAVGLRRWPASLALALVAGLAMLGTELPVAALGAYGGHDPSGWLIVAALLASWGPGALLACGWSAAPAAAALEGAGPLPALARSWRLTRSHRFSVLGGLAVLALLGLVVFVAMVGAGEVIKVGLGSPPHWIAALLLLAFPIGVGALITLPMVASAVIFHGLRTLREGDDPGRLGRIFE